MTAINFLFKNSRPLKYFIFSITCVVFAVMMTSCEQNPTAPNEPPKPPGYQEDIYWPSLADSPWPMEHHDPQNTGRSNIVGPSFGVIEKIIDDVFSNTGIVINGDSTIYFACQYELKAYSFSGNLRWKISFASETLSTPIIGNDGTIYALYSDTIKAISHNGTIKWVLPVNALNSGGMSIGKDGTLYFCDSGEHTLYAVSKYGKLLWTMNDERLMGWNPPTFSPDGNTIYLPGNQISVVAIDIENKKVKWTFGSIISGSDFLVDSDGNIYLYTDQYVDNEHKFGIYSLNQNGFIRWYHRDIKNINSAFAMDVNGNLIYGVDTLHSLNYSGNLNWSFPLNGFVAANSLVCDFNSNIYAISSELFSQGFSLFCIDKAGILKYSIISTFTGWITNSSPAIAFNRLIIPTEESNIAYIIK
ncbi:MAG: PQQ-binding-like beta-propeller repeat protein [Ignavibacteriales bacterium]|nr:PQQ-binding-like beta-propeller repeat protein [Ignavibacteriales bacterium]